MATRENVEFLISVVDKASEKFKQIKKTIDSTTTSTDRLNRHGVSLTKQFSRGVIRGMALLYALKQSVEGVISIFKYGIDAVENYKTTVAGVAALLASMADKSKYAGKSQSEIFQTAYEYAQNLEDVLIRINSKTIVSLSQMNDMVRVMAQSGVALDTTNKKAIQGFINIANAIGEIAAESQNKAVQIQSEIRAVMTGNARAGDVLARQLDSILNGKLKQMVAEWKKQGTLMQHLGELLKGYSSAAGKFQNTWQLVWSSFQTTMTVTMRDAFSEFDEYLLNLVHKVDNYVSKNKVAIIEFIRVALQDIEKLAAAIAKLSAFVYNNLFKGLIEAVKRSPYYATGGILGVFLLGKFARLGLAAGAKELLRKTGVVAAILLLTKALEAKERASYKIPKDLSKVVEPNTLDVNFKTGKMTTFTTGYDLGAARKEFMINAIQTSKSINKALTELKEFVYERKNSPIYQNAVEWAKNAIKALETANAGKYASPFSGKGGIGKFFLGVGSEQSSKALSKYQTFISRMNDIVTKHYASAKEQVDNWYHKQINDIKSLHLKGSQLYKALTALNKAYYAKLDEIRQQHLDKAVSQLKKSVAYKKQEAEKKLAIAKKLTAKQLAEIKKRLKREREAMADMIKVIRQAAEAMQSAFSDIFFDAVTLKFKSIKDAFKSFANSLLRIWSNVMAKMAMNSLFGNAFMSGASSTIGGIIGSIIPSSTSTAIPSVIAAASGGILIGGFQAFANGGIVTQPTLGLVGEGKMNEAVVPLPDGRSIPVKGAATNIQVNINNQTGQPVKGEQGNVQFDGEQYIVNVILKNYEENGSIRRLIAGGAY